jgi:hypothetical protein
MTPFLKKRLWRRCTRSGPGLTIPRLSNPNAIAPVSRTLNYAKDLTVDLDPYTVAVVEIRGE